MKERLNPLKDLVKLLQTVEDTKRSEKEKAEAEAKKEAAYPAETPVDMGIIMEELNPRTKKPYKMSFAEREKRRLSALKNAKKKPVKKIRKV